MTEATETFFLLGQTKADSIRFVQEGNSDPTNRLGVVDLAVEPRDWDVTDPAARDDAAKRELGDDYDYYCENRNSLQWWVNPDNNSAALATYRPRPDGSA